MWFSPSLSAHTNFVQGTTDASVMYVEPDPTFVSADIQNSPQERYRVRIAGGALSANQAGLTYQYIAVSDPGMRFMLGGSMAQRNTAGPSPYPLIDANFLGQFAFLWVDFTPRRPGPR